MAAGSLFNDGAAYERLMGRWTRLVAAPFLDWLGAPAAPRWLDIGCGTGSFTEEMVKRLHPASVAALDPSEGQLAAARAKPLLRDVDFRVAGAEDLPFADRSFDVASMALVIHFVPNPARGVAEMIRVVKPGGCVTAYVWDYAAAGAPTAPLMRVMKRLEMPVEAPPSANVTSIERLKATWEAAGATHVEARPITIAVAYESFDEFWGSLSVPAGPAGKTIAQLSSERKRELQDALRSEAPLMSDGSVRYEAHANAIKGRVPD